MEIKKFGSVNLVELVVCMPCGFRLCGCVREACNLNQVTTIEAYQ